VTTDAVLRPLTDSDLPRLLELNHAAVPAVNDVDAGELRALLGAATLAVGAVRVGHPDAAAGDDLVGFVIALAPGADYASENYRWFGGRGSRFLYVDRIVVGEGARGAGVGVLLYDAVFEAARASGAVEVDCEVNVEPPNPGSMRFHSRLGFAEVGRQSTKNGTVEVALLARPVV
jgi:predicted GNAT superfamily acetyltransferase